MKKVLIVDAQGGGMGRQLIAGIRKAIPDIHIMAVGTNYAAADAMRKAGAEETATGENSVVVAAKRADIIIGPIGMVIADSMLGEITPAMALAIAQADARRILIPFNNCDNYVVGIAPKSTGQLISEAVEQLRGILAESSCLT